MKVIDLLNKIANGEEIPNKIKYDNMTFHIDEYEKYYVSDEGALFEYIFVSLNDYDALMTEVEIIEDIPISKLYVNNELQYNLEKEHKIPEKLCQTLNRNDIGEDYYRYITENRFKINEIIDYLEENK